jgi:hypothetical protein
VKNERIKEARSEEMVDRLIENQTTQLKVVEKFQDQVALLISELRTKNDRLDQLQTRATNRHERLEAQLLVKTNDQNEKKEKLSTVGERDPRQLERQQQDEQMPVENLRLKRKAKAKMFELELEEEVEIVPWSDETPLRVTTEHMKEAFAKNPVLREYASFNAAEMTDPKKAPPFVMEVLMDLVRRGHEAPETRNVQLNPARADQARVKTADRWEVRELGAVTRLLFEAVSKAMKRSTLSEGERRKLEQDVQDALAFAWQLYEGSPTEYVQKAQKPLAAHLVNMVPPPALDQSRLEAAQKE